MRQRPIGERGACRETHKGRLRSVPHGLVQRIKAIIVARSSRALDPVFFLARLGMNTHLLNNTNEGRERERDRTRRMKQNTPRELLRQLRCSRSLCWLARARSHNGHVRRTLPRSSLLPSPFGPFLYEYHSALSPKTPTFSQNPYVVASISFR